MKLFFGIFSLYIVSIGARSVPKIEIFEIRENDNGLELKNLNSNPKNNQRSDSLLKLLRGPPKPDNQAVKFAKQLLNKLKSLRGDERSNRFNDDTHIYILNSDVLDDDSSYEETLFVDKTRDDRAYTNVDKKDIRDILLQLLQPERKKSLQRKRKLRQTLQLKKPVLRTSNVVLVESRTITPVKRHEYAYDDNNNAPNAKDYLYG